MANLALVTAATVRVVESLVQSSHPFAESCTVGQVVRFDGTAGTLTKANGSTSTENRAWGILFKKDGAGAAGEVMHEGVLDGYDLSSMAYGDLVYLSDTDGTLGTTAGTVSTIVGRVIPVHAQSLGTLPDKLLYVRFP